MGADGGRGAEVVREVRDGDGEGVGDGMREMIEAKLRQAEEQVAHWRGKMAEAERQAGMGEGAALARRGWREGGGHGWEG